MRDEGTLVLEAGADMGQLQGLKKREFELDAAWREMERAELAATRACAVRAGWYVTVAGLWRDVQRMREEEA